MGGPVPALCQVKLFWPHEFRPLSDALWGDFKYPYIFFFRTEQLTLEWDLFCKDMGFKENYNPAGLFQRVRPDRLAKFGGVEGYVSYLRS